MNIIVPAVELDAVFGQAELSSCKAKELVQCLCRQILILLTECRAECVGQELHS